MDSPSPEPVAGSQSPSSSATLDDGGESHTTSLHAAAVNGNKAALQNLLRKGDGKDMLDCGDKFGRTPLVYSILADRIDCAEVLLKAGANVHLCDIDGRSPLHWAAYQGNFNCVKLLLSKCASWKVKDNDGRTPLHYASSQDTTKCLSLLLKTVKKGEVDEVDNEEMTPLHWGASNGTAEHVKLLIKAGAQVDLRDIRGKTPLHWSASCSSPLIIKLLLDQNPNVLNFQDEEGRTVLHLAVAKKNWPVLEYLTTLNKTCNFNAKDNLQRTPLHWASVLSSSSIVKLLVDAGAESSAVDTNGACALHYSAQNDCSETVEVLVADRKVKNLPDKEGKTPVMWAAGKGAYNALKTLIHHNADIHFHDKAGGTALHMAAYAGHLDCVMLLIEQGASVNSFDLLNYTPLFRACEMGHAEIVVALLEGRADVSITDKDGCSPLHWAALGGHAYISSMLLQRGLNVDLRDKLGRTPLHCAAHGGFVNCMSVLLEHDADVNAQDRDGLTALHWACQGGYFEAVQLLFKKDVFTNFMEFDGERLTPLDYAIMGDHQDVAQYMIEQGAVTIAGIQDAAATVIQSAFRGYRVRKAFEDKKYKEFLMRHAQLRKEKKRAEIASEQPQIEDASTSPSINNNRQVEELNVVEIEGSDSKESTEVVNNDKVIITESSNKEEFGDIVVEDLGNDSEENSSTEVESIEEEIRNDNFISKDELITGSENLGYTQKQNVAALVIQEAWKKYCKREQFENNERVNNKNSTKDLEQNEKNYQDIPRRLSSSDERSTSSESGLSVDHRPAITKLMSRHFGQGSVDETKAIHSKTKQSKAGKMKPSQAALSYNFAMDQYHPMVSRLGMSRAQIVQSFSQRVRPKSMKRTNVGWAHDRLIAKEMYGDHKDIT